MNQTQFDFNEFADQARRIARREDPETSKAAAEQVAPKLTDRQNEALKWLRDYPESTSEEIDELAGYSRRQLSKRFGELKDMGKIQVVTVRVCRVRGTRCECYRVV